MSQQKTRQLPKRSEIDPSICWDLTYLFADEEAAREEMKTLGEEWKKFIKDHPADSIPKAENKEIVDLLEELYALMGRAVDLFAYANLLYNEDLTNQKRIESL